MSDTDSFVTVDGLVERGWSRDRKTIDRALDRGEIPFIRVGRRRLIPITWVLAAEAGDPDALTGRLPA